MSEELDTHTNVTHKILSYRPSEEPTVVILGTSVTVRCIVKEDRFASMIDARWGRNARVYDLTTDSQTTWEMAAMVDRLGSGFAGVLVIGMTPGLLSFGVDDNRYYSLAKVMKQPKLGFVSAILDEEARMAGLDVSLRTGIYSLDNAHYLLARRDKVIGNLFTGGMDYGEPLTAYWVENVNRPEFWQQEIDDLNYHFNNYERSVVLNLAVLDRLIGRLQSGGKVSIVILESPVNPLWQDVPRGAEFFRRYRGDLQRFAAKHDLPFVPVTDSAKLTASDFVDYEGHIGTFSGRERCSEALVDSLGDPLALREMGGAG